MSFVNIFGGSAVAPANVQFLALNLSQDVTLTWPLESAESQTYLAAQIDVTQTTTGLTVTLPPANQGSTGIQSVVTNIGVSSFSMLDNTGVIVVTIVPGESWIISLTDNTTMAGVWEAIKLGAGAPSGSIAAALAGAGLQAIGTRLQSTIVTNRFSSNQLLSTSRRCTACIWTGANGTFTLDTISTVTTGWWAIVSNAGTGALTVATTGGNTIDGGASITIPPAAGGESFSALIVAETTGFTSYFLPPVPTPITAGGTGADNAGDALTNLGGTAVGISIFTAPTIAAVLAALGFIPPWAVAGGTPDVITVAYAATITTLYDGLFLAFRASFANATSTPNLSPNGLPPHTITKLGGIALQIGDIPGNLAELLVRYNASAGHWELLNPANPRGVVSVDSIAELTALPPASLIIGQSISVLGYYLPGDGGGGDFLFTDISPGPPNSGTIFNSDTPGFYFERNNFGGAPYSLLWFGAKGDGSANDSDAIVAWLAAIPLDSSGYIPAATVYYLFSVPLARSGRISISGEGLRSRLHYTGTSNALTLDGPRFSQMQNWYLTVTGSATNGYWCKRAQEGYQELNFFVDGASGAGAAAKRYSECWTLVVSGGGARQSNIGMWFDLTNIGGFALNNSINIMETDCSGCGIGLDFQCGSVANLTGIDFSNCGTAIHVGRALTAGKAVAGVNIFGHYMEGAGDGLIVGFGADVAASINHVNFFPGRCDCAGQMVHIYKSDLAVIWDQVFGAGTCRIEAGVTRTMWNTVQPVTDSSTNGETSYLFPGTVNTRSVSVSVSLTMPVYNTLAALSASIPAGGHPGSEAIIQDATSTTFWTIAAGGGAITVKVTSDGTNYRIG